MNKKIVTILLFFSFLMIPFNVRAKEVTLHLFHRTGCPHCADEKEYLNEIKDKYPNLKIETYEIWNNASNASLMDKVSEALSENINGVPYTIIGPYSTLGFNENTKKLIDEYYNLCLENDCIDVVNEVQNGKSSSVLKNEIDKYYEELKTKDNKQEKTDDDNKQENDSKQENTKDNKDDVSKQENNKTNETTILPILGEVDLNNLKTPLFLIAVVIGLVDGFNPCAMWVLIFLISMLLGMKDRKRMWLIGITFLVTSALIYLLFMVSWLKITMSIKQVKLVNMAIAVIALIGGVINVYNYLKTRNEETGCTVTDDKKRKSIIERIKKLTHEQSLILALIGVIALAVSVNFVELLCSAGLPVVFTRILAVNNLSKLSYVMYMLIYIICYLLDDIIIFVVAMVTFKITGITNKYNKYSHLIGGIIMLIIGILLIFKPEWLMFGM